MRHSEYGTVASVFATGTSATWALTSVTVCGLVDNLYLPNACSDNAVGYLGNFNGFVIGATDSIGRDASSAGGPAATN